MGREPYAWRYPATYPEYPESNSYRNYRPNADCRHTPSGGHPRSPQREQSDSISSHRSALSSCASRSPHSSRPGTSHASPQFQSGQILGHMSYGTQSNAASYIYRNHNEYDNSRSARYQTGITHHEWETWRFASVGSPTSPGQSDFDQRARQGSNSLSVSDSMSLTYTQYVPQKLIRNHEGGARLYGDSSREQSEHRDNGYRSNIDSESFSSVEESQYTRETYDPDLWKADSCPYDYPSLDDSSYGYQDKDNSSYDYQGSASFGDAYEEGPDYYVSDGGFDENGYPDDDFYYDDGNDY
ncbi:hypothetical protein GGR58DRAFT_527007 [Xylaria digitata]|nr:hypothetical protein GGR58DRAFT_527007 [Xylaria digitata]